MQHQKAFSLIELVVVIVIVLLLIGILLPSFGHSRCTFPNRTYCAANLVGLHRAMYTYSVTNNNAFPKYDTTNPNPLHPLNKITGFQIRDRSRTGDGTQTSTTQLRTLLESGALTNNGTAALFKIVRDGSASTKSFVCPSDRTAEVDPLAAIGRPDQGYRVESPAALEDIYDFGQPQSLSYSFINMYNKQTGDHWGSNASADWVLMSDNNNAPGERKYFKSPNVTPKQLAQHENSQNHSQGEGQNFLYGDGHVKFEIDPFQGPANDNVMAAGPTTPTDNAPLKQPHRDNEGLTREADKFTDVVLISISAKDKQGAYRPWSLAYTQKKN